MLLFDSLDDFMAELNIYIELRIHMNTFLF